MEQQIQQLLLRSLDFELSASEAKRLAEALEQDPELRKEQEELLATRRLLANWSVPQDPDFSDQVLKKIKERQLSLGDSFSRSIVKLFPRIAAACLLCILVMLINIYLMEGSLSSEIVLGIDTLSTEELELTDLGGYAN